MLAARDDPRSLELPQVLSVLHWQVECPSCRCRKKGNFFGAGIKAVGDELEGFLRQAGLHDAD